MVALAAMAEALPHGWCDDPTRLACLLRWCVQSGVLPIVMCGAMWSCRISNISIHLNTLSDTQVSKASRLLWTQVMAGWKHHAGICAFSTSAFCCAHSAKEGPL